MRDVRGLRWIGAGALVALALLSGCAPGTPLRAPPVEDRGLGAGSFSTTSVPEVSSTTPESLAAAKPLPGAENAGRPGYYTVKPGDTVRKISAETGRNWRDIAHWNQLQNPDRIEVGQVLRVVPPTGTHVASAAPVATPSPQPAPPSSYAPAPGSPAAAMSEAGALAAGAASSGASPSVTPSAPESASSSAESADQPSFIWPAAGKLLATFDEAKNKGYDIGGRAGDPVLAAADGRVVYAGAGLRGYGNLIILKHNNTFLTAYAHNQTLLVKEDQTVRKGQKIAEMGSTDADRVKLHFEIRRMGKPVDPARYLAAR
jgi:lipoprotein NlpD